MLPASPPAELLPDPLPVPVEPELLLDAPAPELPLALIESVSPPPSAGDPGLAEEHAAARVTHPKKQDAAREIMTRVPSNLRACSGPPETGRFEAQGSAKMCRRPRQRSDGSPHHERRRSIARLARAVLSARAGCGRSPGQPRAVDDPATPPSPKISPRTRSIRGDDAGLVRSPP